MSGTALTTRVLELFGFATDTDAPGTWRRVLVAQQCPYLGRPCLKTRKSAPDVAIGTCSVAYGASRTPVIVDAHEEAHKNGHRAVPRSGVRDKVGV
jgi:hypothetical protein